MRPSTWTWFSPLVDCRERPLHFPLSLAAISGFTVTFGATVGPVTGGNEECFCSLLEGNRESVIPSLLLAVSSLQVVFSFNIEPDPSRVVKVCLSLSLSDKHVNKHQSSQPNPAERWSHHLIRRTPHLNFDWSACLATMLRRLWQTAQQHGFL